MKIAVVGTGYVGLVLGACLAENGNDVICVDKDAAKIATLEAGEMPIFEPGLAELVRRNHSEERLTFTTDLPAAVRGSDIAFIAVGTPQGEDGSADLQHVLDVARDIGRAMTKYMVVVDKSTVPVGTAKKVHAAIAGRDDASVQRRQQPGVPQAGRRDRGLHEAGSRGDRRRGRRYARRRYHEGAVRSVHADRRTDPDDGHGERRAVQVRGELDPGDAHLVHERVANVCELTGANVDHVRKAIGADRRIGSSFLFPGVGYGGSCFPKDIKALLKSSADKGYEFRILRAVEAVNDTQKSRIVGRMEAHFTELRGRTIAIWGLAFKPRTDDMREAPAIAIIERLLALGAIVRAYDPEATVTARRLFGDRITLCEKSYDALAGADALTIVTEWNEFREPNFARMRELMRQPVVFDGRNIYSPEQMRALGFTYVSIGR